MPSLVATPIAVEPSYGGVGIVGVFVCIVWVDGDTHMQHAARFVCVHALGACDKHTQPKTHLDRLDGVLYLEEAPLRTECVDAAVILAACEEHRVVSCDLMPTLFIMWPASP
jgi:hypothetical protein